MIKQYKINIIREPGDDPLTGEFYPFAHEEMSVEATSDRSAYVIACATFRIKVRGQQLRFFVDGREYFDEQY
jgi:hypothetical protein